MNPWEQPFYTKPVYNRQAWEKEQKDFAKYLQKKHQLETIPTIQDLWIGESQVYQEDVEVFRWYQEQQAHGYFSFTQLTMIQEHAFLPNILYPMIKTANGNARFLAETSSFELPTCEGISYLQMMGVSRIYFSANPYNAKRMTEPTTNQ